MRYLSFVKWQCCIIEKATFSDFVFSEGIGSLWLSPPLPPLSALMLVKAKGIYVQVGKVGATGLLQLFDDEIEEGL